MASSLKIFRNQANYREIAGLWLGLGTVVGLLELMVAVLAFIWMLVMYRAGDMPLADFVIMTSFFSSFMLASVVGWMLFARRWYWGAMVVGGYPILVIVAGFALAAAR